MDKLGKNISKACPTYVTSQFILKLQSHIAQHIVLHVDQITHLDKAIEAACRIKQSFTTPTSKSPTSNSPGSASTSTLADWKPERSHQGHPQQRQNSCWTCGKKNHISRHCTKPTKPPNKKTPEVCRNFNKFTYAHCEQANHKCFAGRLHKCSNCNKRCCKAVRHKESTASSPVAGLQSTDSQNNEIAPGDQDIVIFGLPAATTLLVH